MFRPRGRSLRRVSLWVVTVCTLTFTSLAFTTEVASASSPPDAPPHVWQAPGNQEADVAWAAPPNSGSSALDHFTITTYDYPADTPDPNVPVYTATASQTSVVIPYNNPVLVNGQNYFFVVVACNIEGLCGPGTASPYAAPYAQYNGDTTYDSSWSFTGAPSNYQSPDNITGLLEFTIPNQGAFTCSASVIPSVSGEVIATAAHCVNQGGTSGTPGQWFSNFTFIPAYNGDAVVSSVVAPYGFFNGVEAAVPDLWLKNSDLHDDFALILVGQNSSGQTPQQAVGALGIQFRAPLQSFAVRSTGYPAAAPYNSNLMYGCGSNLATREHYGAGLFTLNEQSDGSFYGYGCDGGEGMSGGPNTFTSGLFGSNVVVSVRSYHDPANVNHKYGPYLGMQPELLWHELSGY